MNKKVLITGGTCGLGEELANIYASNGYDVIFTYFKSVDKAFQIKDKISKKYENVSVEALKLDVREEEHIKTLISGLDRLDVLINNAAINIDRDFFDKTKKDFEDILCTNLVGPFLLMKYAYPLLKESKGNVLNITSTNGIDTMYIESADYDASKAGLINLTKNVASFFAPFVRVNAIAPGWINTNSTCDMNPEFKNREVQKIAMRRFADVEEIAKVAFFITSEDASYVNGAIIRVDGGVNYGL